jgi:protein SCO1/2
MKRAILPALLAWLSVCPALAGAMRYPVTGLILQIDQSHRSFLASCSEIPGYMKAMVMPIPVREAKALAGLKPSMFVDFNLVVDNDRSYAENVRVRDYENLEQEPLLVRRLQLLAGPDKKNSAAQPLAIGAPVSDFTLTDQTGQRVSLSHFSGKVVGITFIYTTCPLPDYCFRLSNNFGRLQKRFAARMGRDLILLSISFDPAHDRPDVLEKYAGIWKADPGSWHFLTGTLPEVKAVCHLFGLNFWPDEATVTHSLHTVIIDRQGKLAANFEGNEFTAEQLGDFVETTLNYRPVVGLRRGAHAARSGRG